MQPLGYARGPVAEQILYNTTFQLYVGKNHRNITTFSWLSLVNIEAFTTDLMPLINTTFTYGLDRYSSLTFAQFGTEAFYSRRVARLSVDGLSIAIERNFNTLDYGTIRVQLNTKEKINALALENNWLDSLNYASHVGFEKYKNKFWSRLITIPGRQLDVKNKS